MGKVFKSNFLLVAVLLFTLLNRTYQLNQFPIGITHDELNYVIAAKSLFWSGNFAPGSAPAILPTNIPHSTVTVAEIPAFLLAPIIGPLDLSLLNSRVLGSILSTLIVLATYLLAKLLTKNRRAALVVALVMSINPWAFLMGRTIFETNFFVTFFLWGLLVLLYNRSWRIFYALPLFILGFFSYTGGQIAFYLFIIASLGYHYFTIPKQRIKPYLIFFCIITFTLFTYVFTTLNNQSYSTRGGEIYSPFSSRINDQVNSERKLAIPSNLNELFINKATIYTTGLLDKYLNAFSVNTLFLKGEFRAAFSLQKHGTFFFLDFLFMIAGIIFLFTLNKKGLLFTLVIIAGSIITSALSIVEYSYSQRAALMFPFLSLTVGVGIFYSLKSISSKIMKRAISVVIICVYALLFINLMHLYFFRFPIYASDGWFYQDRILSRYIALARQENPETKIVVSTFEPKIIFQEYLFYTNNYHGKKIVDINKAMNKQNYTYENVTFTDVCPKDLQENIVWINDSLKKCESFQSQPGLTRITQFKDVYENYLIKNDEICRDQVLSTYISPIAFLNLEVEKQSKDKFCQSWLTKL